MVDELSASRNILILLVSDDVLVRNSLRAALTDEGYLVLSASHSGEATELAQASSIPIALLVYCLPEGAGKEAAQLLIAKYPAIRAIVTSPVTGRPGLSSLLEKIRQALA